uniref:RING-type domain-containing protein n=1 Tax=Oryza nivara TaxID=4536 RepID=A0A0E0HKU4_ORYNI
MNPASRRHYDSLVARYGDQDALADRFGGQNDGPDAWWSNLRVRMSQDHLLRHEARRRAATLEAFEDRENSHDGAFGCGDRASAKAMVTLHQPNLGETREQDCAVCLEPFEEGNTLRMMPCFHSFHQRCIFSWLRISRICPVCRFTLPSQADFESEKAEKERVSASPEDGNN